MSICPYPGDMSFHGPENIGMIDFKLDGLVPERPRPFFFALSKEEVLRLTVCTFIARSFPVASSPCFHKPSLCRTETYSLMIG